MKKKTRFINTIGFYQLLGTSTLSISICTALIVSLKLVGKDMSYVLVPGISSIAASLIYFLNKIDKKRVNFSIENIFFNDDEFEELRSHVSNLERFYVLNPSSEESISYFDSTEEFLKNEDLLDYKMIVIKNNSLRTTLIINFVMKNCKVNQKSKIFQKIKPTKTKKKQKEVLQQGYCYILVRNRSKAHLKVFNTSKYCRTEKVVLSE